jgi:hypothetical protein
MTNVGDPFPPHLIPISDAFDQVYQAINPDFEILEKRLNPSDTYYGAFQGPDAKDDAHREALRSYDQAQRRANEWLWGRMCQGILIAWVWDIERKEEYQFIPRRWTSMSDFEMMGVFETGKAIVRGERRDIFFNRKEFENVLSEIAQPTTGVDAPRVTDKGGRLPKYDWDAMKAFAFQKIKELGRPHRNNKNLRTKAQLIKLLLDEWSDQYNEHPTPRLVRSHVIQWLTEFDEN